MNYKLIFSFSLLAFVLVVGAYILFFVVKHEYVLSEDPAVWGQLGDYIGGLLNPTLSFLSLVLIISSLRLQNEANESLISQIDDSRMNEKLRVFENLFFNTIESRRKYFEDFRYEYHDDGVIRFKKGKEAADEVTFEVESIAKKYGLEQAKVFIKTVDSDDSIYDIIRSFFITVKLTNDRLSDENGFQASDRKSYISTLIYLTELSELHLIMIGMQFLNYPSINYLKESIEFNQVLEDSGLTFELIKV
ncbi:TPA: hypothetical protein ACOJPH_001003 [Vibrio campbellii]|uniref:hypothetical protein n=1 Tax=Vibrio campbellii TaxID=680 RepID=UPI00390924A4